jgi:hypothetical protein
VSSSTHTARKPLFVLEVSARRLAIGLVVLAALAVIPALIVGLATTDDGSPVRLAPGDRASKAVAGATDQLDASGGALIHVTLVNIWNPVQPNMAVRVDGPAAAKAPSAWSVTLSNGTSIALAAAPGDTAGTMRLFVDRPLPEGVTWTAIRYAPEGATGAVVFERQ